MIATSHARCLVSVGLAAGLLFSWVGPAAAADPAEPKTTTDGATTTIAVHSVDQADAGGDMTGPPKPGDSFGFTDNLTQGGTLVGTDTGKCTVEADASYRCEVSYYFPSGTLVARGGTSSENFAKGIPFEVPLISGTGTYSGATGTVRVAPNKDESSDDTLTFTTPDGDQAGAVPTGGVNAGGGGTYESSSPSSALLAVGSAAMVAAAALFAAGRRRSRRA